MKSIKGSNGGAQINIFDWIKQAEELAQQSKQKHTEGSLNIDAALRAAITEDIKNAHNDEGRMLSRYEVAAKMSELTAVDITKTMLDNYTASSHEAHRFPVQFLPALIIATGGQRRAFELLSRTSGLFALPGPDALRAEVQRIEERITKDQKEKEKRMMLIKEMEGAAE